MVKTKTAKSKKRSTKEGELKLEIPTLCFALSFLGSYTVFPHVNTESENIQEVLKERGGLVLGNIKKKGKHKYFPVLNNDGIPIFDLKKNTLHCKESLEMAINYANAIVIGNGSANKSLCRACELREQKSCTMSEIIRLTA